MSPVKFKAHSRDQEQPSTENLLHISSSSDNVPASSSVIPSTSEGNHEDLTTAAISELRLDSKDDDIKYQALKNQASDNTSITILQDTKDDDLNQMKNKKHLDTVSLDTDGATSCDGSSLQFDETSIAASEDLSVYCGALRKPKSSKSKEEQQMRDIGMWRASNSEVLQNLLSRRGTHDEQIKWEAIANARGLCTLTDSCTCRECRKGKYLTGVAEGDGGLGGPPLFDAMTVGCEIQ